MLKDNMATPSPEEIHRHLKTIPVGQPLSIPVKNILIRLQFRYAMRPEIGYAYLVEPDTMKIQWVGEKPIFRHWLGSVFCRVFLSPMMCAEIKGEQVYMRHRDFWVKQIEIVSLGSEED